MQQPVVPNVRTLHLAAHSMSATSQQDESQQEELAFIAEERKQTEYVAGRCWKWLEDAGLAGRCWKLFQKDEWLLDDGLKSQPCLSHLSGIPLVLGWCDPCFVQPS